MKFMDAILDFFKEKNIKTIFSYPGEQIYPLYKALDENEDVKNIMVRHEQGAAHAADGYARITNYVGVCLATAGPGATNLTTGIATAYKDSSSVLCITGRCQKKYIGENYFQEIPMEFLNFFKGYFVETPDVGYFEKAFNETLNSRKPIHINIPRDVLDIIVNEKTKTENNQNYSKCNLKVENVKRPLLLIGQGIYGKLSYKEITKIGKILEELNIPIVTTFPARGVIDENDDLCLGLVGRRGSETANKALLDADVVYSIGSSLSYNTIVEGIRDKVLNKIISINPNPNNIKELKDTLLNLGIDDKPWIENLKESSYNLGDYSSKIKEIIDSLPNNTIITTDAGNHTVFTCMLKKCSLPKTIISSNSMGTMGFGLPVSIGVKFGCLDYGIGREVVLISGDGGFQMNIQELGVIAENNLKILMVIMKNNKLNVFGEIRNPNFNKIADAYGIDNAYIEDIDEIGENVKSYLKKKKPYLMVVECEDENLPRPFG
ncbi:thiamine pyrophosphate-binding protein [Methanotorris formicicus]|nr:thiamine pyrophosphate-binding protein [Methanotorris formicicus]